MKLFCLTCVLLFAFTAANAQESSEEDASRAWFKLQVLASGDTEQERLDELKRRGLSQEGARAIIAYVDRGLARMREVSATLTNMICDDQLALREGGQEAFAQLVERHRALEAKTRRELVRDARPLLSETDQLRFDLMMSGGPKVGLTPSHVEEKIRDGRITVEFAIERMCRKPVEDQSPRHADAPARQGE